jgi:class 3 adenylate cyclase
MEDFEMQKQFSTAMAVIQKAMGPSAKAEHLNWARNNPTNFSWLGKPCLTIWDVDVAEYKRENIPARIRGGFLMMAFPENLPENLWLKRIINRRARASNSLKFPLVAINLSDKSTVAVDSEIAGRDGFIQHLLRAYINRSQTVFEFGTHLARAGQPEVDAQIRLLSIASLEKPLQKRREMFNLLWFAAISLLIIAVVAGQYVDYTGITNFSLRKRIASIFMIAILMPVLSLISLGKTFIAHEEIRLKDSAFVKMRSGLESLDLRYKDTPRLIETQLFKDLHELMGEPPFKVETLNEAMKKACERGLIAHYLLADDRGKMAHTNWNNLEAGMKKVIELAASKILRFDSQICLPETDSVLKNAIDEEFEGVLEGLGSSLDFSRPTHLRYYAYMDQHMYFMSINARIDGKLWPLFVHLPEHFLEKHFASREFTMNRLAADSPEEENSLVRPELSFYTTFKAEKHFPPESDVWPLLENVFQRSYDLKVEESGQVRIGDENFLYLIKPLTSMPRQSFIPCLLSSTRRMEQRLREAGIVFGGLVVAAIIGTILLSLLLASSLLVPISRIDAAAQLVGKGNLNIILPDMGTDEIGRLSQTINDMVRGLREREKMQAYVSDSVLEAIQDDADATIHAGKHIEATILFSDIRNFTGLTEENTPDKIFALLNEFLGGVEPIIRSNYGRVDKFIGDAVMAVFHHTTPEHHSLSAVKAAVQMKRFVKKLNHNRTNLGLFTINIGIGISTGTVLLGDVGSTRRKYLTVIGDEVNLASRLESASKKVRHSKIIF